MHGCGVVQALASLTENIDGLTAEFTYHLAILQLTKMAIANGTCVSFCNQPKGTLFGYLTRVTPVCRCLQPICGCWHLATSRESKARILASPGYAPETIAVNITRIQREFNAGQKHCSMCPSIFNRLRAIARYWSEIATFSYPLAFNAFVGGVPIGIQGKCWSS